MKKKMRKLCSLARSEEGANEGSRIGSNPEDDDDEDLGVSTSAEPCFHEHPLQEDNTHTRVIKDLQRREIISSTSFPLKGAISSKTTKKLTKTTEQQKNNTDISIYYSISFSTHNLTLVSPNRIHLEQQPSEYTRQTTELAAHNEEGLT